MEPQVNPDQQKMKNTRNGQNGHELHQEPGDGPAEQPDDQDGCLLHVVRDVRQGRSAADLSPAERRACIDFFVAEGLTTAEIAVLMQVTDRTIRRDRQALRESHAVQPGEALGNMLIGELCRQAEDATARLRRAVRNTGGGTVNPHMRMRAEIQAFKIRRDLIALLAKLCYIPSGEKRLEAEARANAPTLLQTLDAMIERESKLGL